MLPIAVTDASLTGQQDFDPAAIEGKAGLPGTEESELPF